MEEVSALEDAPGEIYTGMLMAVLFLRGPETYGTGKIKQGSANTGIQPFGGGVYLLKGI